MNLSSLQQYITHPELLDKETLYGFRTLLARYPYCQTLRLLYLKNLYILHDTAFGSELRKSALYIQDRKVLFYLIEEGQLVLPSRPPKHIEDEDVKEEQHLGRTLSLIDAFLSEFPQENVAATTGQLDYTTDYTNYLMQEEAISEDKETIETPQLRGQELIDGFIACSETESGIRLKPLNKEEEQAIKGPDINFTEENDEDSYFTETLAKIYIRQQRYSKALEIIKRLSLKYPKKNAYFADQIRFLEKLIINANSK